MNHAQFWGGGGAAPYAIDQSLRFDNSSAAHLSRTLSASGNRRTFTLSWWLKRGKLNNGTCGPWVWYGANGYESFGVYFADEQLRVVSNVEAQYNVFDKKTAAKYRDPSAWMHIVVAIDTTLSTADDRVKIYVNGERITSFTGQNNNPSQNHQMKWNDSSLTQRWIRQNSGHFDGYQAEIHHVDGTALGPTTFGEYDDNGVWRPIEVDLTTAQYGSQGFYLDFSDASDLGADRSGNGNDWTLNNFTTSGTGTDVMSDTPTNNFATLNPLEPASASAGTLSDGNLYISNQDYSLQKATFRFGDGGPTTGKYYWEVTHTGGNYTSYIGVTSNLTQDAGEIAGGGDKSWFGNNTSRKYDNSTASYTHTYSSGDVHGYAIDLDAQEFKFYVNGTLKLTDTTLPDPATTVLVPFQFTTFSGSGYNWSNTSWNFGQRAFSHQPTGYSSLCTANLPAPDIKDGSKYFDAFLYNGTNSSSASNKTGDFTWTPDFVWIKNRNGANSHRLVDVVRGTGKSLISNSNGGEINDTTYAPTAFISGGFTTETSDNSINGTTSDTYVAWNWLAGGSGSSIATGSIDGTNPTIASTVSANTTAGFSVGTFTGTSTAGTIAHGLGNAPKFILIKRTNVSGNSWAVYHDAVGANKQLLLNSTNGASDDTNGFPSAPTSTVINVGTGSAMDTNQSGAHVFYAWAEVEGYSKFGSYTGNNNSDNVFVHCGFAPAWLLVKSYGTGGTHYDWRIYDSKRNTYNPVDNHLEANQSLSEDSDGRINAIDFLSNGFKIRNSYAEVGSSTTYIFAAFAEHPFGGSGVSPATAR